MEEVFLFIILLPREEHIIIKLPLTMPLTMFRLNPPFLRGLLLIRLPVLTLLLLIELEPVWERPFLLRPELVAEPLVPIHLIGKPLSTLKDFRGEKVA